MNAPVRMQVALWFALFLLIAISVQCSLSPTGGGGHDGDAVVAHVGGVVVDQAGTAVAGIPVMLLASDFDPVEEAAPACGDTLIDLRQRGACAMTNDSGRFGFQVSAEGVYRVSGVDTLGRRVYSTPVAVELSGVDSLYLGELTLRTPGVMLLGRPDTLAADYAFVSGTAIAAHFDTVGDLVRLPLPVGTVNVYLGIDSDGVDSITPFATARDIAEGEIVDSSGVVDTVALPGAPRGPVTAVVGSTACYWVVPVVTRKMVGVEFRFALGDGTLTAWSRDTMVCHAWMSRGRYRVSVQARSAVDTAVVTPWSDSLEVVVDTLIPPTDSVVAPRVSLSRDSVAMLDTLTVSVQSGVNTCSAALEHQVDFGNASFSDWTVDTLFVHTWNVTGIDSVRARSRCSTDTLMMSTWSPLVELRVY